MSMLLDQALVEDVARYCPEQFLNYHKCLSGGDVTKCFEEQEKLSTCVKTSVPTFIKILKDCDKHLKAYENCLRANQNSRSECFDKLQEMRKCSANAIDIAKAEEKAKEGKASK
ncbi:Mitochondrial intermembrane space cysteine motif-containing protein [Yarrowia sp. B02]|nr:Mitochondrial intermembrane space cysteine motif-containing protein [Yarrowia sp. B02]